MQVLTAGSYLNSFFRIGLKSSIHEPSIHFQNQVLQSEIFVKHFGKMDPDYSKWFFTNRDKWSTIPPSKDYDFEYTITFLPDGDVKVIESKSTPINQPKSNNPDKVILPFNIYYVQSNSQLIGIHFRLKPKRYRVHIFAINRT